MDTTIHFINVGQGNMTLIQLSDGTVFLYDCNVTGDNQADVLSYVGKAIGWSTNIDVFVNSHRDADHMRGILKVHKYFPIKRVWDSGVTGTTPDGSEYKDYMRLRLDVGYTEVERLKRWDYGNTRLRVMNAKNETLAKNPNAQSIVMKVVHRDAASDKNHDSVMLTGDTDAATWKDIRQHYQDSDLSCSLLLASHHGSITYFDDPADSYYYVSHLKGKSPEMTIISVGDNGHGHPHDKALEFYEKHSSGSNKGNKVYRTDEQGHMKVVLKEGGGWTLTKTKSA